MNKDRFLLIISLLALMASGWILYSSFGGSLGISLPGISQPTTMPPVQQTVNNIKFFDSQIQRSLNNLGPTGLWQTLLNNVQYQQLSDQALVPIEIGERSRINPFDPLILPATKDTNAQQ